MLNLTYTLLVKSGTHSLYLFSQLPLTCILSSAVYLDMLASFDQDGIFPALMEFGRPPVFAHLWRYIKKNELSQKAMKEFSMILQETLHVVAPWKPDIGGTL